MHLLLSCAESRVDASGNRNGSLTSLEERLSSMENAVYVLVVRFCYYSLVAIKRSFSGLSLVHFDYIKLSR